MALSHRPAYSVLGPCIACCKYVKVSVWFMLCLYLHRWRTMHSPALKKLPDTMATTDSRSHIFSAFTHWNMLPAVLVDDVCWRHIGFTEAVAHFFGFLCAFYKFYYLPHYLLTYLLTYFVCIVTESNYGSCFITCCRNGWKALTTGWRSFYSVNHWPTTKSSWSCTVRSLCSMCIASFIRTLTADCAHSQSTCSLRTWLASWLRTHHLPRITSVMWKLEDRMSASLDEFKDITDVFQGYTNLSHPGCCEWVVCAAWPSTFGGSEEPVQSSM